MYLQGGSGIGATGLGACVVPKDVAIRKLICTEADLAAIGGVLALGRDPVIREVRTAIEDAARRCVVLIERAETQLRRPRASGQGGDAMRARFRDAFGRPPEFVPTWRPAGQTWDIGAVVRERLRCAAKIMSEGDIEFVAWGPLRCPFAFAWTPGTWAVVEPGRYRICLGQRFWHALRERDAEGMATTLLHECLHIYFDTIRHRLEVWPFNRATCYERYVLVANGMPVPDAVGIPCPSGAPVGRGPAPRQANRVAGFGLGQPTATTARERRLMRLAKWPGDALAAWKTLDTADRSLVVLQMAANYGSPFSKQFLSVVGKRDPRQMVEHYYGRGTGPTPATLATRGYKLAQKDSIHEWWVHPTGERVTRNYQQVGSTTARPSTPAQPRPDACLDVDRLSSAICANADQICKIAAELNDEASRKACERARASCERSRQQAKACQ